MGNCKAPLFALAIWATLFIAPLTASSQRREVAFASSKFTYPEQIGPLRDLDFKNLKYPVRGETIQLGNGEYRKNDDEARVEFNLNRV
jgi:hypothetical protein